MRAKASPQKAGDTFTHPLYGTFEVLSYKNSKEVLVKFHETGTETITQGKSIRSMQIRDYNYPHMFGVGFFGYGRHKSFFGGRISKPYSVWRSMLQRCYDEGSISFRFYSDCTVCELWHNFQNFADWYEKHYVDGHHVDKDTKIRGNKVYSPETCVMMPMQDNIAYATSCEHSFVSPVGDVVTFINLNEFCRENDLNRVNMARVKSGQRKSHKGWTRCST